MDSPGPKYPLEQREMLASLLGMFASLLLVEKVFSIHGETRTASPSPCCPAETVLGWAQPQFGTGEGSGLCPPRGAGKRERGRAGGGHAGRIQLPLVVFHA